jgi:hypothetical protein
MGPTERRPSRAGYWIGGLIALLGVAGGVALLVATFTGGARDIQRFGRLDRVAVPGQAVLSLPAGKHVVYVESTRGEPPVGGVDLRVADASTERPVALAPYATTFTYNAGGRSGRAMSTFVAAQRGRYSVATSGPSDAGLSVAVGPPLGGKLTRAVSSLFLGFGLLFGGPVVGGAVMLFTMIRRNRFDRRTEAGAAPASAPATPAAGWYPDPQGKAGWRWWDGQRWTDHTG